MFSAGGNSPVIWAMLPAPESDPEAWRLPRAVVATPDDGPETLFSAVSDGDGNIHLTVGTEGIFIGYTKFDGQTWSTIRQLSVNNVYGPAIASDGGDAWAFWVRNQTTGLGRIEGKR